MQSSCRYLSPSSSFLFFIVSATSAIYTLSLHDALPICSRPPLRFPDPFSTALLQRAARAACRECRGADRSLVGPSTRSEEHTSELQSLRHLVCRLLLEKKKLQINEYTHKADERTAGHQQ